LFDTRKPNGTVPKLQCACCFLAGYNPEKFSESIDGTAVCFGYRIGKIIVTVLGGLHNGSDLLKSLPYGRQSGNRQSGLRLIFF
jgi:hypothetical protein